MKPWHSLRARLALAYAGLLVIGFTGLALLAGRQISQGAMEDYEHGMATQAVLIGQGMKEVIEGFREGEISQAAVASAVATYAAGSQARLTLIDSTGRAWLDSSDNLPSGNLQSFPEVTAALNGQNIYNVYPNDNGTPTLYTAAPVLEDGRVLSVVRLAAPLSDARSLVMQRWLTLSLGIALLAALALVASWWLAASLTRPLDRLRHSALEVAQGNFAQRLPEDRQDEVGELAAAFNHMAGQVQAMLDEQRAFASNASHELRTPLTTIRLRSEALRTGHLDEETTRRYIAEIDDETTRLSYLVNDLMLLSRFDTGRAESSGEMVDPSRLARQLTQELAPRAARHNVHLELEAATPLPPVQASQTHLRVVFYNLLDNAFKYTPEGGEVCWRLWVENDALRVEVRDSGQGIAAEDLPHLFERFYRADKARTRTVQGSGLGLSLVHSVVTFYGGRITIESEGLGQGTVAHVWWPLA